MATLYTRDGTETSINQYTRKGTPLGVGACPRCGGTGRFSFCEVYRDTCFQCHGSGKALVKLYTRKHLDRLNRNNARSAAKRAAQIAANQKRWALINASREVKDAIRKLEWRMKIISGRATRINAWIGSVGERREFTGIVRAIFSGEGRFGAWYLTIIDTDNGTVIWWNLLGSKGARVRFSAGIKDHNERNGEKQTVVQRATKIVVEE